MKEILLILIFGYLIWVFLARKTILWAYDGKYNTGDIWLCIIPILNIITSISGFTTRIAVSLFINSKSKTNNNIEEWFFIKTKYKKRRNENR